MFRHPRFYLYLLGGTWCCSNVHPLVGFPILGVNYKTQLINEGARLSADLMQAGCPLQHFPQG